MDIYADPHSNYQNLDNLEVGDLYQALACAEAQLPNENPNVLVNKQNLETAIEFSESLYMKYITRNGDSDPDLKAAIRNGTAIESRVGQSASNPGGLVIACKSALHDIDKVMYLENTPNITEDEWEKLHVGAGQFLRLNLQRVEYKERVNNKKQKTAK